LLKRFRDDAGPLLACQKSRKTQGLSHDTLAQCGPLIDAIPSSTVRRELASSLSSQLQTAATLGLDNVGLPMSSDPIASLFGLAKQHGVGEIKDAVRLALRLPALCGTPTREEAQQVLEGSVAAQKESTGRFTSLTKQRREVLPNPDALERLRMDQSGSHVELMPRARNRSNTQESTIYQLVMQKHVHPGCIDKMTIVALNVPSYKANTRRCRHPESKN